MKHKAKAIPMGRKVAEAMRSAILRRNVNFVIATRRISLKASGASVAMAIQAFGQYITGS
jgi:hypothetical protein